MRRMKRNLGLSGLTAACGLLALTSTALADVTTERSGSILVFPKVIWDGTRDTVIQISNTSNLMVHALCFYINAAPVNPSLPVSSSNPPQWLEIDFDIWLSKQQPTQWTASLGRRTNFFDPFGSPGAGLDPGLIPPVALGFTGELKCIETDEAGAPLRGNHLKGEATLRRFDGDVSKYNAISILGNPDTGVGNSDNDLVLDNTCPLGMSSDDCRAIGLNPGEYNACPDTYLFNHFSWGAQDQTLTQIGVCDPAGGGCPIQTNVTIVPCQQDLEQQRPGRVTVQFQIFNEFEEVLSASTTIECWLMANINTLGGPGPFQPFTIGALGTPAAYTRINPVAGNGGILMVAEEVRTDSGICVGGTAPPGTACTTNTPCIGGGTCRRGLGTAAAYNVHTEGNRFDRATDGKGNPVAGVTDHMIIPLLH